MCGAERAIFDDGIQKKRTAVAYIFCSAFTRYQPVCSMIANASCTTILSNARTSFDGKTPIADNKLGGLAKTRRPAHHLSVSLHRDYLTQPHFANRPHQLAERDSVPVHAPYPRMRFLLMSSSFFDLLHTIFIFQHKKIPTVCVVAHTVTNLLLPYLLHPLTHALLTHARAHALPLPLPHAHRLSIASFHGSKSSLRVSCGARSVRRGWG